jgi:hypothetical protein
MPETPPSKSHTKTVANMQSALEYYAARDEHVSFEGILQPDKNNDNNTLIIVNSTELYSVPTATLLPVERVYTGLPQRVWVPKNTQVWRCELTNLDLQTQEHVKAADLPNLLDKHLSADCTGPSSKPRSRKGAEQ